MTKTNIRKELDAEIKAQKKANKTDGNTLLDRALQGVGAGVIIFLAFYEILRHVRATEPVNYILAAGAIVFLLYLMVAPTFRR
jgi:hypothetical protein